MCIMKAISNFFGHPSCQIRVKHVKNCLFDPYLTARVAKKVKFSYLCKRNAIILFLMQKNYSVQIFSNKLSFLSKWAIFDFFDPLLMNPFWPPGSNFQIWQKMSSPSYSSYEIWYLYKFWVLNRQFQGNWQFGPHVTPTLTP
jgi:hypothetical protein